MRTNFVAGVSLVLFVGCGSEGVAPSSNGGGQTNANATGGRSTSSGGSASTSGGTNATGGATVGETGGKSNAIGGTTATTSSAAGGTQAAGGSVTTGGTKTAGSSVASGGTKAAGGASAATGGTAAAAGGSVATGGTNAAGGASAATGGTAAAAGGTSAATGGTKAAGGTKATGGTSAAGGAATGGATTAAGGAATFKCANLSFAPSATGKAQPTGATGGMKVLDWAGFSSAISYTFDDANSSQISNYAAMKSAGGHYTFYLITSKTEASSSTYKTALADGNEIGNHTVSHDDCTDSSNADVTGAQTFIKNTFGVTAYAFAAPDGSSNCDVARVQNVFLTDRSVAGGSSISVGDTSKFTWLPADIPATDGSGMGPTAGKWRVLCIHGFQGGSDGAYQAIPLSAFTSAVQSALSGGSWVETVSSIAAYNWGQKAIGTNTTSATWTLPSVFPPNMCVRITTTGGTVTQKGAEVPWDSHGYYQISLDAGEVTIK